MNRVLLGALLVIMSCNLNAASDWYKTSGINRYVYVKFEQPVGRAVLEYKAIQRGKCVGGTKVMNFMPGRKVTKNRSLISALGLSKKIINGKVNYSSSSRTDTNLPSVYFFRITNPLIRQFHYRISYMRNGVSTSRGWAPDRNFKCLK